MNEAPNHPVPEENIGYAVIGKVRFSGGDAHLSAVLAYRALDGQYVTWIFNHQTGGFAHGHYFHPKAGDAESKARADFSERSRR